MENNLQIFEALLIKHPLLTLILGAVIYPLGKGTIKFCIDLGLASRDVRLQKAKERLSRFDQLHLASAPQRTQELLIELLDILKDTSQVTLVFLFFAWTGWPIGWKTESYLIICVWLFVVWPITRLHRLYINLRRYEVVRAQMEAKIVKIEKKLA